MKIIVAMDSFKGCCSAVKAGDAVCRGILRGDPDAELWNIPVADGGEGTVEAVTRDGRGTLYSCKVTGPMGDKVDACFGSVGDVAVIEMSAASGLPLVPKTQRNPLLATSYGTGELIRYALDAGFRRFLIGIGGSATNDGGAGMMQALGVSFQDAAGEELKFGGAALTDLAKVDISKLDSRLAACEITVASDVTNPLCGPNGATYVFGQQKGATPDMQLQLEKALRHYADVIQNDMGINVADMRGAGAAGGMGAAMQTFLKVKFCQGIQAVLDIVDFKSYLENVDMVFTGEGRTDAQTIYGKVPAGVAELTKQAGDIPVYILSGGIGKGAEALYNAGVDGIYSIADGPITLEESQRRVEELLERLAESLTRSVLKVKKKKGKSDNERINSSLFSDWHDSMDESSEL